MERNRTSLLESRGGARDQAVLPTRTAFQLCLRGIETRLERSLITLIGVAMGIAFLMSVLCGFHIKGALKSDAEMSRDVERRIAVLRSEIGMLDNKEVLLVGGGLSEADARFVEALREQGADLPVLAGTFPAPLAIGRDAATVARAHAVVCLGEYETLLGDDELAAMAGKRCFTFEEPSAAAAARLAAKDIRHNTLSVKLRPDELAEAERKARAARQRMVWIVIVSLLITVGGITNAMLMSVTERFREIATMKCLGALSGFVVKLFLIESSLMGFAGAVFGSMIGMILPLVAYGYTFGAGRVIAAVAWGTIGLYAAGCVVAGVILAVVAGIYPARVAARMIPADALRSHV